MLIAVGGMVGSGKSTLVKRLSRSLSEDWLALQEFREDDVVFNTLLKLVYEKAPGAELALQSYFIQKHHSTAQKGLYEYENVLCDRFIMEHLIFAQVNLKAYPHILTAYKNLYNVLVDTGIKPSLYIILHIDWETFESRIMKRGRDAEVKNFEANKDYFRSLLNGYTEKLVALCQLENIPYHVIASKDYTEEEIECKAIKIIKEMGK